LTDGPHQTQKLLYSKRNKRTGRQSIGHEKIFRSSHLTRD
jgi:hypothetical protein